MIYRSPTYGRKTGLTSQGCRSPDSLSLNIRDLQLISDQGGNFGYADRRNC